MAKRNISIKGKVLAQSDSKPLPGLQVEAWDKDLLIDDLLGTAVTDKKGAFSISFNEKYYKEIISDRKPDIYFKVWKDGRLMYNSINEVMWNVEDDLDLILKINLSAESNLEPTPQMEASGALQVKGKITYTGAYPITAFRVHVFQRELSGDQALASANVNRDGKYSCTVTLSSAYPALMAVLYTATGQKMGSSPTDYEHRKQYELNITAEALAQTHETEYGIYTLSIQQLLGETEIGTLNAEQLDLLAGKTQIDKVHLGIYQAAWTQAARGSVKPEALYGLFRVSRSTSLTQLYEMSSELLREYLGTAIKDNIISDAVLEQAEHILEQIQRLSMQAVLNEPFVPGGSSLAQALGTSGLDMEVQSAMLKTYRNFTGSIEEFWEQLPQLNQDISPAHANILKFTVQSATLSLGSLQVLNSLQNLRKEKRLTDTKGLTAWNKNQWEQHLQTVIGKEESSIPSQVPGNNLQEKIGNYARAISRLVEHTYPTQALAARMVEKKQYEWAGQLQSFVQNNPSFQLGERNIDEYLKENKTGLAGISDKNFIGNLKSLQRKFLLSPGFERDQSVAILDQLGVDSSVHVTSMGWKNFSAAYTKAGGSLDMAGMVYEMATHNMAAMQNVQMTYGLDMALGTYATAIPGAREYLDEVLKQDPDLATLFGSLDYCECKHCRSIYGPAAYLVDLFQFLRNASSNTDTYSTALDVLMSRRPDLCKIDLNCDNANTALPYIDLLNEILENAILQQELGETADYSAYQTTGITDELLAHPEHMQERVYDEVLSSAYYPWTLPFDLWTEEARAYLDHLKLPRYKIMDLFYAGAENGNLTDTDIVNEVLKLGSLDREILLGASSIPSVQLWGLDGTADLLSTLENIENLLDYSGLEFSELEELLKTWFVNPDGSVAINFDTEHLCDLDYASLDHVSEEVLMNMLRMVRMRSKLGWKFRDIDIVLKALGASEITELTLTQLSHITRLQAVIKLPLSQLSTFWGNIYTGHVNDESTERSPYELLFLNKTVLNPVDAAFSLLGDRSELADTANLISDHLPTIKAALGISSSDLELLLDQVTGTAATINLANLSALYRYATLARALKLSIEEVLDLIEFQGSSLYPFTAAHTEWTLLFIENYLKLKKARWKISELDYILRYDYDLSKGVGPKEESISDALTEIQAGLKKIVDEYQMSADPQGETTRQKMAMLLSAEDLNTAIAMIEHDLSVPFSAAELSTYTDLINDVLGPYLLDPAEALIVMLDAVSMETDKQKRYEYILESLLYYLRTTSSSEYLKQKIAAHMGLDTAVAERLLFLYIYSPDDAASLSGEILLDETFVSSENESIELADFPEQFNTYVLLHKTSHIFRKLKVGIDEVDYLFAGAFDPDPASWPGWFNFNALPVLETSAASVPDMLENILRLIQLFDFYQSLPESDYPMFELMLEAFNPASASSLDELLEKISLMTGWELSDIQELSNTRFSYSKTSYQDEKAFIRIRDCIQVIKITGASAADMSSWTTGVLSRDVSSGIVNAIKSLYSDSQWLNIARPLRDVLREKQRSAMTDWLIFHQPGIDDSNDLYGYYLVDPEMSACMLSSRIRLALSSVQLFVQRCRMNLEEEVVISNNDQEHWDQWQWMKNYRLWEANRKIFCYPENWLEPELRDDKSDFFKELEQELSQGEVTAENVEKAYINYLSKLEAVSNMDILGICHANKTDKWNEGRYVFGRTKGSPGLLYFREYTEDLVWTPWKKMDIDFEGNHLIPLVYNNKLHVFWPVFNEKNKDADLDSEQEGTKYREIQMAWSMYENGAWTSGRKTQESINELSSDRYSGTKEQYEYGTARYFVSNVINDENELELSVYERYMSSGTLKDYHRLGTFVFNASKNVRIENYTDNQEILLDAVDFSYMMNQEFVESDVYTSSTRNALKLFGETILSKTPSGNFSLTYVDQGGEEYIGTYPYLFQDYKRCFFIRGEDWKHRFFSFYHPYVSDFINAVNEDGVEGLLDPEYDPDNSEALSNKLRRQQISETFFEDEYGTRTAWVHEKLPVDEVDFSMDGAYAIYNWELFFHIPMLIAGKLSSNQQFSDAQQWYHYIFDPTDSSSDFPVPQRFWKLKPFMEIYDESEDGTPASIQELMMLLSEGDEEMEAQVEAWREDPFNPHLIARMRISAYQKNVVMKYIDNLFSWGDMLFRQDTMESTDEAMQIYALALYILGEEPRQVEGEEPEDMNYCELKEEGIDDFSNALITLETKMVAYFSSKHKYGFKRYSKEIFSPVSSKRTDKSLYNKGQLWFKETGAGAKAGLQPEPGSSKLNKNSYWQKGELYTHKPGEWQFYWQVVKTLYFCIPQNDKLLSYWDFVDDRMFKLRHCMNIEGRVRQLPLYEKPIDPAQLVNAAASGMDLSSALNDLNAALPNYRFTFTIEKARQFAAVVRSLGDSLLAALEKKDAEALALLRATNEIDMLEAISQLRKNSIEENKQAQKALEQNKIMAGSKERFYSDRERINAAEVIQLALMGLGMVVQASSIPVTLGAASAALIPSFSTGGAGMGGSPYVSVSWGGSNVSSALSSMSGAMGTIASVLYQGAGMSGIIAGMMRRTEEWDFMAEQAKTEEKMIDRQLEAAALRVSSAEKELDNHEKSIEQRKAEYDYMKSKFSNKDLYDWMLGQISALYFQAYQLAYDLAKRAEQCYHYELPESEDTFVSYGYWDSLKKGLLSGERLENDLMRMEASYMEKNKRTYEISKHISLAMLSPYALLQLKENGLCYFSLPEELFDMDHPGHYLRRIKSVSLTIPCVAGPYAGVNAKLTLGSNYIRATTEADSSDPASYAMKTDGSETRFLNNLASIQSIALSSAQDDSGLFVLNFNDERYLPFEGAGVISNWALEMPDAFRSFDYNTISDVIISVNYTAKDGGEILKEAALASLQTYVEDAAEAGLTRMFSMKHEFSNDWYRFLNPQDSESAHSLSLSLEKMRFPYMFSKKVLQVKKVDIMLQLKDAGLYNNSQKLSFTLSVPVSGDVTCALTADTSSSSGTYAGGQPALLEQAADFSIEEEAVTFALSISEAQADALPDDLKNSEGSITRLNKDEIENMFIIMHYCAVEPS